MPGNTGNYTLFVRIISEKRMSGVVLLKYEHCCCLVYVTDVLLTICAESDCRDISNISAYSSVWFLDSGSRVLKMQLKLIRPEISF